MNTLFEKLKIYGPKRFFTFAFYEIYNRFFVRYIKKSYSQYGEDLVIDRLLKNKKRGFYVDIGAYDPDRFSNTKRFYLKGWNGINIEPNVVNYNRFIDKRKRDTNLNIGIGNTNEKLTFYTFIPDTLSTFSKVEADTYQKQGYTLVSKKKVSVRKLEDVLKTHIKHDTIDFMSIDTEGFEMAVLNSNDWKTFKPTVICIESRPHTEDYEKECIMHDNILSFLNKKGYKLHFENATNSIFLLN